MTSVVVEPDAFREWMAPTVAAIREFANAVDQVCERHRGLPNPTSGAMGELADEQNYRARSSWKLPITDTHAFGLMTLWAANDYVRSFAELFAGERPPLYAHSAIARSALESAVVSEWLSEPVVGPLERIKRGLCEQLYSAKEVHDLGLSADSGAQLAEWKAVADSFGWSIDLSRPKPIIDGTKRPRVSDGIVRLTGRSESRIGDLLFSRLSAVAEVVPGFVEL